MLENLRQRVCLSRHILVVKRAGFLGVAVLLFSQNSYSKNEDFNVQVRNSHEWSDLVVRLKDESEPSSARFQTTAELLPLVRVSPNADLTVRFVIRELKLD